MTNWLEHSGNMFLSSKEWEEIKDKFKAQAALIEKLGDELRFVWDSVEDWDGPTDTIRATLLAYEEWKKNAKT